MNPNLCPKCGAFDPHGVVYRGCCKNCIATGPAPKEEEMDENHPVIGRLMDVAEKAVADAARTAERRDLARDAYMAALGGHCVISETVGADTVVTWSANVALETVRRWDALLAAVDAEGGE